MLWLSRTPCPRPKPARHLAALRTQPWLFQAQPLRAVSWASIVLATRTPATMTPSNMSASTTRSPVEVRTLRFGPRDARLNHCEYALSTPTATAATETTRLVPTTNGRPTSTAATPVVSLRRLTRSMKMSETPVAQKNRKAPAHRNQGPYPRVVEVHKRSAWRRIRR